LERFNLFAVEKVRRGFLIAEEEPVPALRPNGATLLEKRAEGRDARPRTDHDERRVGRRRMKRFVAVNEHRHGCLWRDAVGEEGRTHAFARATKTLVTHGADGQMNFAGMGLRRG